MSQPWSITGWSTEFRQVGPEEYRYKVKDPEGKTWHRNGVSEFTAQGTQQEALAEMKDKVRSFVSTYAAAKAPVQVYTFFDENDDPREVDTTS
ncbi:hypothetical protein SEA_BILLNYE_197 [Streptomyces phage BillNye]|uniref:Uncharacterized protein n=2 Tax=Wilnyevirus billnye TaxID=2560486 RepID=A0A2L1IVZ6_9CAUD|nr:hypothetical protein FDJ30_gp064 [Streptomyces phage BillNye]AVD99369.1 hypothetical protein SEA_BILLNYE_197 [Streptomyces phage BillNye]QBZ72451.1 hypothetical protein SEA_CIRCINUS_197 [Streptomyces phage Circinus]